MADFQVDTDNRALLKAIEFLRLKFPAKAIEDKTGYSKGNISKYLSGKLKPSSAFLNKFQESFNINLDDFEESASEDNSKLVSIAGRIQKTQSPDKEFEDRAVNYVVDNRERLLQEHRTFQLLYEVIRMQVEIDFMRRQPER